MINSLRVHNLCNICLQALIKNKNPYNKKGLSQLETFF